jgi:protein-tyrosine phosphatase
MESYTEGGKVDSRLLDAGQQFIDIHCHCLPGLDDGPATLADALVLCRTLADDGVKIVIATPHQQGRFDGRNEPETIRNSVRKLNEHLRKANIEITVLPGADIRIDERIPSLLEKQRILTLADGGHYILLELPHDTFIDAKPLLRELSASNITTIISHPERHRVLSSQPQRLSKWLETGAHLQITAGSLLGCFGPQVEEAGWFFLRRRWASFVASDAHDIKQRCPMMKAAFEKIRQKFGQDLACLLCIENPSRVINSEGLEPVDIFGCRDVYNYEM